MRSDVAGSREVPCRDFGPGGKRSKRQEKYKNVEIKNVSHTQRHVNIPAQFTLSSVSVDLNMTPTRLSRTDSC